MFYNLIEQPALIIFIQFFLNTALVICYLFFGQKME